MTFRARILPNSLISPDIPINGVAAGRYLFLTNLKNLQGGHGCKLGRNAHPAAATASPQRCHYHRQFHRPTTTVPSPSHTAPPPPPRQRPTPHRPLRIAHCLLLLAAAQLAVLSCAMQGYFILCLWLGGIERNGGGGYGCFELGKAWNFNQETGRGFWWHKSQVC